MKFYAIEYQVNQLGNHVESIKYYAFTCKFLSERIEIDSDFYEELRKVFNIAGKNNNHSQGIYFKTI